MVKMIDIKGQRFGRLVAIKVDNSERPANSTKAYWLCKCDCGNSTIVSSYELRHGTESCGCLIGESAKKRFTKHGGSGSKLYMVWSAMRQRCDNSNNKDYPNYGARGIHVSQDWAKDFAKFKIWSESHGYQEGLTLDRVDVNGNYEPDNCRWVTMKVQANNERFNRRITFDGETHTLADWADKLEIKYPTLSNRINTYGWTVEKAFTLKPKRGRNQYG
ncbi:hypothetical protein GPK34_00070 [Secundilactobacillus kimchicus]|uniref:hypothetical protein n=1 Tax=Secundilactobacillus kimchicus TaxID=528209 RepID=UPI001C00A2FE|nr:hypothetical protein [Secundilactobacillus kimchicus]MBT9670431.1 hypothetical protein [Secundilactobacillus kimchicus]